MTSNKDTAHRDLNRDPVTGEPGSHPVGVGVGSAAGGAAAGALAGTVFGPIGTLVGAGVGVIAGAAAGKGVAERIDPTGEVEYWRQAHADRPYTDTTTFDYDRDYSAAYGFGLQAREQYGSRGFEQSESELRSKWEQARGQSRLDWDQAKPAVRDSWGRADLTHNTYAAADQHFQERFQQADYKAQDETFDDYRPAYRYGVLAKTRYADRDWDDSLERELAQDWQRHSGGSRLDWERARAGVREAFTSPYIDTVNSPYDQIPDYNENAPAGSGLFRVR